MLNWKSHLGEWGSKILVGYGTHMTTHMKFSEILFMSLRTARLHVLLMSKLLQNSRWDALPETESLIQYDS